MRPTPMCMARGEIMSTVRLSLLALAVLLLSVVTARSVDPKDPKDELTSEEKTLLELTNKERAKQNLKPLTIHPLLLTAARKHSLNMAKKEMLEHILDGKSP